MKRFTQSFSLRRPSSAGGTADTKTATKIDARPPTDIAGRSLASPVSSPLATKVQSFAPGSAVASPNVTYHQSPALPQTGTVLVGAPGTGSGGIFTQHQSASELAAYAQHHGAQCAVCQQLFTSTGPQTPKIAPCLHTICQQCISTLPGQVCPLDGVTWPGKPHGELITNWMVGIHPLFTIPSLHRRSLLLSLAGQQTQG